MSSAVWKIETGVLALSLVDTAEVGYLTKWQAPGGAEVFDVTVADYAAPDGGNYSCQITSGALTPTPNSTTDTTPPTFCGAEVTTTSVGVTSFALDAALLQDPHIANGISAYLVEHDTKEAYFYLGLGGDAAPPAAIGRCRLVAGAFGGDARVTLVATLSLPCSIKPDFWFGDATTNRVVKGDGTTVTPTAAAAAAPERELEDANA